MSRIERLAALLDEPLLVAGPPYVLGGQANVRYLTGLESSNAAVLVEPDGHATLFTDFRYAQRAKRAFPASSFERDATRAAGGDRRAAARDGRSGSRRSTFRHAALPRSREARVSTAVPTTGLVESLARREGRVGDRRRCAGQVRSRTRSSPRSPQERFTGRTERELAWWIERSFREAGAEGVSFDAIVAAGDDGASPHAVSAGRADRARRARHGRRRLRRRRLLLRLHAHVRHRRAAGAAGGDRTRCASRPSSRDSAAVGPGVSGRDADAAVRGPSSRRPASDGRTATASATASGSRSTRRRSLRRRVDRRPRGRERRLGRAGHLPPRRGRRPHRGLVLVTDDGRERLTRFAKELVTVDVRAVHGQTLSAAPMAETVVTTNEFRNGMHIELDGSVWRIVEFQHVKPGKGGAFVRTKVKALETRARSSTGRSARARSSRASTPRSRTSSSSTTTAPRSHFMDEETFEQFGLPHAEVADELAYLPPSSTVQMLAVDGKPAGIQLPASVELDRRRDRAGGPGRHRLERDEAGDARDGRGRAGTALRRKWRAHQGRPSRGSLHRQGLTSAAAARDRRFRSERSVVHFVDPHLEVSLV